MLHSAYRHVVPSQMLIRQGPILLLDMSVFQIQKFDEVLFDSSKALVNPMSSRGVWENWVKFGFQVSLSHKIWDFRKSDLSDTVHGSQTRDNIEAKDVDLDYWSSADLTTWKDYHNEISENSEPESTRYNLKHYKIARPITFTVLYSSHYLVNKLSDLTLMWVMQKSCLRVGCNFSLWNPLGQMFLPSLTLDRLSSSDWIAKFQVTVWPFKLQTSSFKVSIFQDLHCIHQWIRCSIGEASESVLPLHTCCITVTTV